MKLRKRSAQESAAAYRRTHEDRLDAARVRFEDAQSRLHEDRTIQVDLPATEVPSARVVLNTHDLVLCTGTKVSLDIVGPERIAVVGPNGSGKTTMLHTIAGLITPGYHPTGSGRSWPDSCSGAVRPTGSRTDCRVENDSGPC